MSSISEDIVYATRLVKHETSFLHAEEISMSNSHDLLLTNKIKQSDSWNTFTSTQKGGEYKMRSKFERQQVQGRKQKNATICHLVSNNPSQEIATKLLLACKQKSGESKKHNGKRSKYNNATWIRKEAEKRSNVIYYNTSNHSQIVTST